MFRQILVALETFHRKDPAVQLIVATAREQWRLLAVNVGSSLLQAVSEGSILAVVFWAVKGLSAAPDKPVDWSANTIISRLPGALELLTALSPISVFLILLAFAVLLQALQSVASFANKLTLGYFSARCTTLVKARIHSQVLNFSFPCASGYKIGDLTHYAASGPAAVQIQIVAISGLIVALLMILAYIIVFLSISPRLLLAALLMGVLVTVLQRQMLPRIVGGSRQLHALEQAISQRVTEDFQALRLLHSTGQLEAVEQHLRGRMTELERVRRAQVLRSSLVGPISSFLPILIIALTAFLSILIFGGNSSMVLPSLVTFVLAMQRMNQRISGIAGIFNDLADNTARLERLNKILSPEGKQFRRLGGTPFTTLLHDIRFESVSLRYASELPQALCEISFTLRKGETVALVGPSGAGKSSIADLLTGLYTPSSGAILIDGITLDQIVLATWQQRLGVVSQDTFLFNATIAENVAFGSPGVTLTQIESACQAAQAAGFIHRFPKGYDTLVGERGYRLSGGQRQRLSLARAILRQPELLILDEATSALDCDSERLVQQAMDRFGRNHTVLVIAHRLSTIIGSDLILVVDGGRVIEQGNHASLLAQKGLYGKLWQQQTQLSQSASIY